jgi:hypothetical protein
MGIAISIALVAQQRPADVEFEVVSIKPADPAAPGHWAQQTPGGFRGRNLRLFELIMSAWHLNRDQLIGDPGWLETAGWDIDARFPDGASPTQAPQMMQAMLADRFQLVTIAKCGRFRCTLSLWPKAELSFTKAMAGAACQRGRASSGMARVPWANWPASCPVIWAAT